MPIPWIPIALAGSSLLGGLLGGKGKGRRGQIETKTIPRWSPEQQQEALP